MRTLDRRSPLPLWAQLEADLRARIAASEFEERFPTDEELVQAYGVSRQTVREAVRRMSEAGILERQRGRGSFLARPAMLEQPMTGFYSLAQSITERGMEEHSAVLRRELLYDKEAAAQLEKPAGSELSLIERLRFAGGEPLVLERSWLDPVLAGQLRDEQLGRGSLYELLATQAGVRVTGGRERVRAAVPNKETRRLLELPEGEAVLVIERLALAGRQPIEWRITIARGDRFSFTAETGFPLPA